MCHNWPSERLYEAEMVAASSYQKEGRAAPAMLSATASTATISGSHAATTTAGRRPSSTPRLNTPLCCQKRTATFGGLRPSIRTYDRSMGSLASIGYNGQPVRSPFRVVRPPIAVLVDLTVLFPREPHRSGRYQPNGLQLHKVVEGCLSCWALCEQGDWWGLVTYPVAYGSQRKTV